MDIALDAIWRMALHMAACPPQKRRGNISLITPRRGTEEGHAYGRTPNLIREGKKWIITIRL